MLLALIDLSQLLKSILLLWKLDYLDIIKLVNVPTSLNNLKTKVDNSDIGI